MFMRYIQDRGDEDIGGEDNNGVSGASYKDKRFEVHSISPGVGFSYL